MAAAYFGRCFSFQSRSEQTIEKACKSRIQILILTTSQRSRLERLSNQPMKLKTTKKRTRQQKEKSPNAFSGVSDLNSDPDVSWSLSETVMMMIIKHREHQVKVAQFEK